MSPEYGREHYLKIKKVVIPSQNEYRLNNLKYGSSKSENEYFSKKKAGRTIRGKCSEICGRINLSSK
jgi:hypothetical protein